MLTLLHNFILFLHKFKKNNNFPSYQPKSLKIEPGEGKQTIFKGGVIRQNKTWSHTEPRRTTLTHGGQVDAVRHRLVVLLHSDRFLKSLHLDDLLTLVELGPGILVIWPHFYNLILKRHGFILFSNKS